MKPVVEKKKDFIVKLLKDFWDDMDFISGHD